ncbi:MAG: (Fe-S)-binding protein [Methylococcales bacterium]|nr:(Fe-S)-binding protein [Methylococcales bacterium]MBT7444064.1 (Fe-S)-binding protein [Methylococcales bacterium]
MNQDTELCVKCGLCSPHCPTYFLTQNEADSPRGRISLIQGLNQKALKPTPTLLQHIDSCLQCLACEKVCPSQVPFGKIINDVKTTLPKQAKTRIINTVTQPRWLTLILKLRQHLNWLPVKRLPKTVQKLWLRTAPISRQHKIEQFNDMNATTLLLQGCLTNSLDTRTLSDTHKVLQHLGIQTISTSTCCGSIDFHQGNSKAATKKARQHKQLADQVDHVVYLATGCGSFIKEYPHHFPEADISHKLIDICRLLLKHPLHHSNQQHKVKALLHTPCSAKNRLKDTTAATDLLANFNHIELQTLNSTYCCGGAGQYSVQQPSISNALIAEQIKQLPSPLPDYLVTTNIGCALQFSSALKYHGITLDVVHPITLIALALGLSTPETSSC